MKKRTYSHGLHIEWREWKTKKTEDGTTVCQHAKKAIKRENNKDRQSKANYSIDSMLPIGFANPSGSSHISEESNVMNPHFSGNKKTGVFKKQQIVFNRDFKGNSAFVPIDDLYMPGEIDDPSTAGFLLGLTCILLTFVFGALFIPFIFAVFGVVTSMIGLIADARDQYITGIILAMCGLAMCSFVILYLLPIIGLISAALFTFFMANPGVLVSLLLLLGMYLLMNGI